MLPQLLNQPRPSLRRDEVHLGMRDHEVVANLHGCTVRPAVIQGPKRHRDLHGWTVKPAVIQGPKDHRDIRILHSGPKAQDRGGCQKPWFVGLLCLSGPLGPCVLQGPEVAQRGRRDLGACFISCVKGMCLNRISMKSQGRGCQTFRTCGTIARGHHVPGRWGSQRLST